MNYRQIVNVVVATLIVIFFYFNCESDRQFSGVEGKIRERISPVDLQKWATGLLAQYPSETQLRVADLGTNFPSQLRGLAPRLFGSAIYVHGGDSVPSVVLRWGTGGLGSTGVWVGPTNFVCSHPSRLWVPGIYFYQDR